MFKSLRREAIAILACLLAPWAASAPPQLHLGGEVRVKPGTVSSIQDIGTITDDATYIDYINYAVSNVPAGAAVQIYTDHDMTLSARVTLDAGFPAASFTVYLTATDFNNEQSTDTFTINSNTPDLIVSNESTPISTGFGPIDLGTIFHAGPSNQLTLHIENTGPGPLSISAASVTVGYRIAEGLPTMLPAGAADEIIVELDHECAGVFNTGVLTLLTDDLETSSFTVKLKGKILEPETDPIRVTMPLDIRPGSDSSIDYYTFDGNVFAAIGSVVFFPANDGIHGYELWRSDGTSAGTKMVKDIYPGSSGSDIAWLTTVGNKVFFNAYSPPMGSELWVTDGTTAGTQMVREIDTRSGGYGPGELTALGNKLIFAIVDSSHGSELWESDGTSAGTKIIRDLNPGSGSSAPDRLKRVGNKIFYKGFDGVSGHDLELCVTDGTFAGTQFVADLYPGSSTSSPDNFSDFNGLAIFNASNGSYAPLWRSDGTFAGTSSFISGFLFRNPFHKQFSATFQNKFFFSADGPSTPQGEVGLWVTDATEPGTMLIKDIGHVSPDYLAVLDDQLLFSGDDSDFPNYLGNELWRSDGTTSGTRVLRDIRTGSSDSNPRFMTKMGDKLIFSADGYDRGNELWITDGTSLGTRMLRDIRSGTGSSFPEALIVAGDKIFFAANDGMHGEELWVYNPNYVTSAKSAWNSYP